LKLHLSVAISLKRSHALRQVES